MRGTCEVCGQSVEKHHQAAWPVRGYELERAKGANGIYDRQREPNRIFHAACLKAKGQSSLMAGIR